MYHEERESLWRKEHTQVVSEAAFEFSVKIDRAKKGRRIVSVFEVDDSCGLWRVTK